MLHTERVQLKYSRVLSRLCHLAKNLYNTANWNFRQFYFNLDEYLSYYDLDFMLKSEKCYKALPAQTSQQILRLVIKNWKSYFRALVGYRKEPSKFPGCPRMPRYKSKNGESICIFTNQNTRIKNGRIHFPSSCNLEPIKTRVNEYRQVRILPRGRTYVAEIIYNKEEIDLQLNKNNILGIDLGINNLLTTANNIGLSPLIVKGKVVKSINQYYNKQRAKYQSKTKLQRETRYLEKLTLKRENKIRDYFHKASRKIIEYCIENDIGMIIIGYNEKWKQKCRMGRRNNQNFVQVPFHKIVQMIEYKAMLVGVEVIKTEESYTSKCSALDLETIEKSEQYLGKRIKRGLFRSGKGVKINADVNGAFNIIRKVVPITLIGNGIEALVLKPQIIAID